MKKKKTTYTISVVSSNKQTQSNLWKEILVDYIMTHHITKFNLNLEDDKS